MRNKIKRATREAFRHIQSDLGPFDYNVVITAARRLNYRYPKRLSESLKNELVNQVRAQSFG